MHALLAHHPCAGGDEPFGCSRALQLWTYIPTGQLAEADRTAAEQLLYYIVHAVFQNLFVLVYIWYVRSLYF